MAGGKLTPRQKMINLMYLVFIAMLAMNMSKEVLSAFGLMNEKFEAANSSSKATNEQMLQALDTKASEAKGEFVAAAATAHKVQAATKKFYDFVGTLKAEVLKGVEVDKETAIKYLQKKDIQLAFNVKGWVLLSYCEVSIGFVKVLPNRINNYYPKEWRILKDYF